MTVVFLLFFDIKDCLSYFRFASSKDRTKKENGREKNRQENKYSL